MIAGSMVILFACLVGGTILLMINLLYADDGRRIVKLCYLAEFTIMGLWATYGLIFHVDWSR